MGRLANKVALIVGESVSDRFGVVSKERALALTCARDGAAVLVADRNLEVAQETAKLIVDGGGKADAIACDATQESDSKAAVQAAIRKFGGLHLLVNSVGEADRKTVDDMASEDFETLLRENILGHFNTIKHVLPEMRRAGGGAVVVVSSLSALRSGGAGIGYETTKAALLGLTRNIALSAAADNVRVNAVLPGVLDSAGFRGLVGEDTSRFTTRVPLQRLGTPWEFAQAVTFLLSDEASFITGANLLVDGGMAMPV
jgi:NAD(P)-dependent dehydrogenase (short-subunit alcohol dehydrogenase family)